MHISYNWLKEYVDIPWEAKELSDRLTMGGLEVEGLELYETLPGGLAGVVVGEVLSCERHPNADKLSVCAVDIGEGEPATIVCGAPNVAAGQKVVVATVGTMLYPTEGEPFKIKKAKIRGQESFGMICAEDELGLGSSHAGIIVLDTDVANGTPASGIFEVETDHIMEIGLTPNRVDAASHFGTARDVAALQYKAGIKARLPEIPPIENGIANPIAIELPEPARCDRYVGIYIEGVTIGESPEWMQHRLKSIGLRPINNIVDITNFVLHELGQPLHAFDADQIRGKEIVVKTMPTDTKFNTLDKQERVIRAGQDLMICDAEGPVAVAGVMGGLNSEVEAGTKNVFLESAYFEPSGIRRTASYLGLKTDASYRFERGVDPNITKLAALRATQLILELAGGQASVLKDENKGMHPPFEISLDIARANIIMGREFSSVEIIEILNALDITAEAAGEGKLALKVPAYRVDVQRPQDVMEEVLRIYGYNNIALPTHNQLALSLEGGLDVNSLRQKFFNFLAACGFHEIVTNPLVPASTAHAGTANLINNLSEDMAVLRDEMVHTGLNVIEYNHNRQNTDLRLVEFGKTYHHRDGAYVEKDWLCYYITGDASPKHWSDVPKQQKASTFFTLARELERLQKWFGFKADVRPLTAGGLWAYGLELYRGDSVIARYGKVSEALCRDRDFRSDVFYAAVDWAKLLRLYRKHKVGFQQLPKFPSVRRDISMIVMDGVQFADLAAAIRSCNPKLIRAIGITDVYQGPNIGEGRTSYLLNVTMLDENKTLTDKTVDKLMGRIYAKLEEGFEIEIRK